MAAAFTLLLIAAVPMVLSTSPAQAQTCPGGATPTATDVPVTAVPIVVESTTSDYFVLYASHDVDGETVEYPVRVTLGEDGATTLAENVAALPKERYRVEKYLVANPADVDGDCTDDVTELANQVRMNPVNPAKSLELAAGAVTVNDHQTYEALAYVAAGGGEHLKFVITDFDTSRPSVYFQNTRNHRHHASFFESQQLGRLSGSILRGTSVKGIVTYDPDLIAPDGSLGLYHYVINGQPSLWLWPILWLGERIHTLLAASMPVLDDNLGLRIVNQDLPHIQADLRSDQARRAHLVFDDDVDGDGGFLTLNPGEGYGLLRSMEAGERPHSRDVVIYETLPNELPRVAGIISTVPQTPLSHVNLRALQDGVPNAFIADALEKDDIGDLIDNPVHFAVSDTGYSIRAATQTEVDEFYASSRPAEAQTPQRDLAVTSITPLGEIGFEDWDSFGVKAANVAVLGTLGFPEGTVPDGFAVPFYFYDEFMKHNDLYDEVSEMLADSDFQTDYDTKVDELKKLRKKIKKADTPEWIDTALTEMHASFPEGTSLRYRSSTNNEDLPGFNGAGLYDSKTQHPEETEEDGISKSLKQVYASLWNFRAFIERDFHRIDHMTTAMGVLVHPNYSDESVNGVAVSVDPSYGTEGTHYVNSQLGEDLVTNPEAHSEPEEVLLYPDGRYTVVALSNQVPPAQLLMTDDQMAQLRRHLDAIHEKFAELYALEEGEQFAMEIEFKITSNNTLAIKQARPWIFSPPSPDIEAPGDALTAVFDTAPAAHDGAAFDVRIRFSDDIGIGADEFRRSAVAVTGGYVASARRVNRRSDLWEMRVHPYSGLENVTITLAHNRRCLVVGAICASDGRRLSNRLEHTVQVPPATPDQPTATAMWSGIVDLEWNEVDRADSYDVQLSRQPSQGAPDPQWIDLPNEGTDIAFYGAGAVIKNLPLEPLRFRVRAVNAFGESQWSQELLVASTGGSQAWSGVPEPVNSAATGAPTITGTPGVLETYRVDVSGIDDANGLERVKFRYQWTRNDGTGWSDIDDATGAAYSLTADDAGKDIRVRVTFVDRQGFSESLLSSPGEVAANNSPATGAPAITGTVRVGETLTADTSGISDADGLVNATFSYQWLADDINISEATGSTYALVAADVGKAIQVRVSFTDDAGNQESGTSEPTSAVPGIWGGTVTVGDDPAGTGAVGYSVFADSMGSITSPDFVANGVDNTVDVIAYNEDGLLLALSRELSTPFNIQVDSKTFDSSSASTSEGSETYIYTWGEPGLNWATGDSVQVIILEDIATNPQSASTNSPATGTPTITGSVQVDQTLTIDISAIADEDGMDNATLAYQWVRTDGTTDSDIQGATSSTYTMVPADEGKAIKVQVSFTDDAGNDESLTSAATETVAPRGNWPATGLPTISGTAQVGQTLTADTSAIADPDGLDNAVFSYQWGASGLGIPGATDSTYTISEEDETYHIQVMVTFTDDEGNKESLKSQPTAPVSTGNSPATGAPTITGTAQVGETLTADTSGIADEDGLDNVDYAYQWVRNDGTDDTDIAGATNGTYTLADEDQGKTIKVRVAFTDDAENSETLMSEFTDPVVSAPEPEPETPEPPGTPTGLSATLNGDGSITLTWNVPDGDVDGYQILRRRPQQGESELAVYVDNTGTTATTWTDTGTSLDTRYVYRVKARNGELLSERSNYARVDK